MRDQEIRYCTTDDAVRIAYRVSGDHPITLVQTPNAFIPALPMNELAQRRDFNDRVSACFRHVLYDQRGTGMSQRDVEDIASTTWVRDLEAVVRAVEAQRFVLYGNLGGIRVAMQYTVEHPERVSHLVLWPPPSSVPSMDSREFRALGELAVANWEAFTENYAHYAVGWDESSEAHDLARIIRESISRDTFLRYMTVWMRELSDDASFTELAARIRVPTLLLQRPATTKSAQFIELAANIQGARVRVIEGESAVATVGDRAAVVAAMAEFAGVEQPAERERPDVKQSHIVTILVTDLVGHTEMMQRLGDAKGRDVLRDHERITRDMLKRHGGAEVKTMGDGFIASFASATQAVDCAIAPQRALRDDARLQVRVGLNAGEPIQEDGDLFGSTVILASRICTRAGAGEILMPEPLRHLLSGKGYAYADRGETVLKGFEEPVRLFAVRWRE